MRYQLAPSSVLQDRTGLSKHEIAQDIWNHLELPTYALQSLDLPGEGNVVKSSFRIADLAQASISLSTLAAALVYSTNYKTPTPNVSVDRLHAVLEFASERLYELKGKPAESAWGPLSGLHQTKDGYVRMHDGFPNLSKAATDILGLPEDATREQVSEKVRAWKAHELEEAAARNKAVIYRLRSPEEWDASPQGQAIPNYPVSLRRLNDQDQPRWRIIGSQKWSRCLSGLRILDLSRVIAAPVAGRTLAAHGAEVLWITSPNLPSIPSVDVDVNRGKTRIYLDLDSANDFAKLEELIKEADVITQAYRPGALAAKGLTSERLAELRPGIVIANLSAWGNEDSWKERRGFDSIVQTVTGLNHLEHQHHSPDSSPPAKPLPLQALDHAAGYFLATGIMAALYHASQSRGAYVVNVSLAATGKYLRSLGQLPGREGFEGETMSPEEWLAKAEDDVHGADFTERYGKSGALQAVKHAGRIEGMRVGVSGPLKVVESGEARWS